MNANQSNLFTVLQRGDREITKLRPQACMIIGLSRNGKSCFFNHALGRSMVGSVDPKNKQKVIYAPNLDSGLKVENYAEMGNTFTATTLYPNIGLLGNYSLTDMAGFEQNRNEVGVLGVSYFLMRCFQRLKKVKFIVVISEKTLFLDNIELISKSFEQLINLFAIEKFSDKLWKNFMNSIVVVVSCAREEREHYKERLEIVSEQMEDTSLESVKHRELIVQILKTVTEKDHVEVFKQAKAGKTNLETNAAVSLQFQNWQFFDLEKAKVDTKGDVLVIPFNKDFDKLSKMKKDFAERFNNIIKTRVSHFLMVNHIFGVVLRTLRSSWRNGISDEIDSAPIFQEISNFIEESYTYGKDVVISQERLIQDNTKQNIFEIVINSLKIYDLCCELNESIMQQHSSFEDKMKVYSEMIPKMVNCLVPLCTMRSEHEQLQKINFMLVRGFTEFTKFYQLKKDIIDNIGREMIDTNTKEITSEITKRQHFQDFILNINKEVLQKYFNTIPHLNRLEELLAMFWQLVVKEGKSDMGSFQIQFNNLKLEVDRAKVRTFGEKGCKWEVLKENAKVVRLLCNQLNLTRQRYAPIVAKAVIEKQVSSFIKKIYILQKQFGGQCKVNKVQIHKVEKVADQLKILEEGKKKMLTNIGKVNEEETKIRKEKKLIESENANLQTQNTKHQEGKKLNIVKTNEIQQINKQISGKNTALLSMEENVKPRVAKVEEQNKKAEGERNKALIEEENKKITEERAKIQAQKKVLEGLKQKSTALVAQNNQLKLKIQQQRQKIADTTTKLQQKKKELQVNIVKFKEFLFELIQTNAKIQNAKGNIQKTRSEQIEDLHFKIVQTNDKIALHLLTFNSQQFAQSGKFALRLCDISKNVYLSESIYQNMLKKQVKSDIRLELIDKYIEFCKKWGKIETASNLLFEKRHIYRQSFDNEKIKKTSQEMKRLIDNPHQIKKASRYLLEFIDVPLQREQLSTLLKIMDEIEVVPMKFVLEDQREYRQCPQYGDSEKILLIVE